RDFAGEAKSGLLVGRRPYVDASRIEAALLAVVEFLTEVRQRNQAGRLASRVLSGVVRIAPGGVLLILPLDRARPEILLLQCDLLAAIVFSLDLRQLLVISLGGDQ